MQSITASLIAILASLQALSATQAPVPPHAAPTIIVAPRATATMLVTGTSTTRFELSVGTSTRLIAAMQHLASTSPFRFSMHEYQGMGAFVDSIQGTRNAQGNYWILWVNGKKSGVGASSVLLRPKDTIEWKYEKGY
jgi:hypothetical protein